MRKSLILFTLFSFIITANSQDRFVSADYSEYYDWFHQRSQVEQLYTDGATLHVFGEKVEVYEGPCQQSSLLTQLKDGQKVTNIVNDDFYFPEDNINGYGDIWYHVMGKDACGNNFNGYVWGAGIAKAWSSADLNADGRSELIMLGVSSKTRVQPREIEAEIRIMESGSLWYKKAVPELCVFEDCASSAMIRMINNKPYSGNLMVEASTMTVGCWASVEKAFLYWDGKQLERVFHAEYTTEKEYARKSFLVPAQNESGNTMMVCQYSHEDKNYNPVWTCKTSKSGNDKGNVAANDKARAK